MSVNKGDNMKLVRVKISIILALVMFICSFGTVCAAESTVTYEGNSKDFIFEPGSEYSPTDLFDSFKDVMPGDSLSDYITIKNDADKEVKVRVFMRSLGAQEETNEFLSQMNLRVEQVEDSLLFDSPADKTAQLTDWIYIGTLYSGGEVSLKLDLQVPVTMANEYQNQLGYIDWEFKVEELPVEEDDPVAAKTGDNNNIMLGLSLMLISLMGIVLVLLLRRKQREN